MGKHHHNNRLRSSNPAQSQSSSTPTATKPTDSFIQSSVVNQLFIPAAQASHNPNHHQQPPTLNLEKAHYDDFDSNDAYYNSEHATDLLGNWDCGFDFDVALSGGKSLRLLPDVTTAASGLGDKIPGFRTSTTFLYTLRQNLQLSCAVIAPDSPSLSPFGTMSNSSSTYLPSLSPLSQSTTLTPTASSTADSSSSQPATPASAIATTTQDADPLAEIPPLTTSLSSSDEETVAALKLLADSLAQDRQRAASAVIYNPFSLSGAIVIFGIVFQYMYTTTSDLPLIFTTFCGILSALLVAVRMVIGPYIDIAESVNWKWLGDKSEVLVTRFGDDIIGMVVWEILSGAALGEGAATGKKGKKRKEAVLRGWTVRKRERGRGCGRDLIEETIRILGSERGVDAVRWDEDGIYAKRVLPSIFNGPFNKRDKRARQLLEEVVKEQGLGGRKK
ncbi:hypothetical protein MMC25_005502 [Agyrium rufum]|nr:hypothetical protein [Agyrium rufum]